MRESFASLLVVDDDIALCRILHQMLSKEQYRVRTSQSVADALGAIEQRPFDAYVLDCVLPDGAGLDVAERVRSKGSEAPIILISGYDVSSLAWRAEKLRISDFLTKPFSQEIVCNALKKAIRSSKEASELSPHAASVAPAASKRTRFPFWPRLAKRPPS